MSAVDPAFDRPVFIVSPPRSGSSALFETLARAKGVFTVGGESHLLIETLAPLHPVSRGWSSNVLTAEDATPQVAAAVRSNFWKAVRDRDGARAPQARIRLLEKTPKNALRIPFLRAVFPEARFLYLHRDPREVLSSMMEAWESGRFRTYPSIPDWPGPLEWSLVLTPGWRDLAGLPLRAVVAGQWASLTDGLIRALEHLPPETVFTTSYNDFVANPQAEVQRLCSLFDWTWDQDLGAGTPASAHTVSAPAPEKWRRREAEILEVLPAIAPVAERMEAFLARSA